MVDGQAVPSVVEAGDTINMAELFEVGVTGGAGTAATTRGILLF